jgi:hypothetical protein
MQDNVVGRGVDPRSVRARELVHEMITAHIYEDATGFAKVCASIVDELIEHPTLLGAYLAEGAAYTHTVLSAVASGMDTSNAPDTDTVARFHRAMIAAWASSPEQDAEPEQA